MAVETQPLTVKHYKSGVKPTWCPGCGDFGVLSATYKALVQLQLPLHETVFVSGIGCSSRLPYFMSTYGLHGLHGRGLPLAQGVKLGRPELTVFAVGGDGDLFSIGAGHLPHACARNADITVICMDNSIYGLTKGQTSPTSVRGQKTKSTPYGAILEPMNPVMLALTYGASFVARGYSAKPQHLTQLIVEAVRHPGFAFLEVQSPCVEFNNTFDQLDAVVDLMEEGQHDPTNLESAMRLALTEERMNLGVFYKAERASYEREFQGFVGETREFDLDGFLDRYE
jgi:2-oxoglutarate ferredoxin oxidoreductase subunit beta